MAASKGAKTLVTLVAWLACWNLGMEPARMFTGRGAVAQRGDLLGRPRFSAVTMAAKRPPNGYNIFVKELSAEAGFYEKCKAAGKNLMQACAEKWALKSDEEKAAYTTRAKEEATAMGYEPKAKKKSTRPLTGYQLYVKHISEDGSWRATKEKFMTVVARSWKALSVEEQQEWKDAAAGM
mmetsp:Transcript_56806/g.133406  ORF Transcript_56806/g.133406 Transcript_56806/m.133406 type:complete len:180 (+) Transcript_56806:134-673(+)